MLERARNTLSNLPRRWKSLILAGFDAVALIGVLWLSYQLRLGPLFRPDMAQLALMALAPVVALPVFLRFGLYRAVIRYLPERAIWTILGAMMMATLIWVFVLFLAEATRFGVLPRSIPIFYFLLGAVVVTGSRFIAKYLLWLPVRRRAPAGEVVIYGAGEAGRELATALRTHGGGYVAGFLDDDQRLQGRDVAGIRVFPPHKLETLVRDLGVREVVLSMPSIGAARRQAIFTKLAEYPVTIRTLPSISDIASGKYAVNHLREIDIDDLLGRSSVPADPALLEQMVAGRVILVSGAGGSIGSELCRIIARWEPAKLVLFEANEFALYQIERTLLKEATFPLVPVLGSVTDARLVARTLAGHGVEVVFHAAAHKHVPLVEANPLEGVRNNVLGTRAIARAAFEGGVRDFVLISTDKAVRPTNVMGASKRWAELIVRRYGQLALAGGTGQRFCAVRFGNVLGSNGSVVPLFREQIANGGPVTLTDERMTRYFMSIHEAAELIVQAGALSEGGDIFLLEMGEPVRVRDLAENMIRLAGLTLRSRADPQGDIEIVVTGSRAGEKLYEELFYDPDQAERTAQPKILRSMQEDAHNGDLEAALAALEAALVAEDEAALRRLLFGFIAADHELLPVA
jgi:FlaA1/EpsC-like NDP-sugar epimerase